MTGPELRTARLSLGWSERHAARLLGLDRKQLQRAESYPRPIPEHVARWLARVLRAAADAPAWREAGE